jgi:hypothetical protein
MPITAIIASIGLGASHAITSSNSPLATKASGSASISIPVWMPSLTIQIHTLPVNVVFHNFR